MNLNYRGREEIPAPYATVWAFITDPAKIASCMPDVVQSRVFDAKHFEATVEVAVGPVRGRFLFKVALEPNADGTSMGMKIGGGGLGSVVDLVADADVVDNGEAGTTINWRGTATMRGPVAAVGGRVIDAQAKRVITTTFANVTARLSAAA